MPGNGVSGKGGDVLYGTGPSPTSIAEVTKWSFNPKGTNPAYRSNKTGGFTRRVPGYKDGSGSVEGKWDPTNPITDQLDVTDLVTLNLQTITGQRWVVPAVVDSIKVDVDVEGAEIIGWSMDFSTDGEWTKAPATGSLLGPIPAGPTDWPSVAAPGVASPRPAAPRPAAYGEAAHFSGWRPPQEAAPQHSRPAAAAQPQLTPEFLAAVTQAVVAALQAQGMVGAQHGQAA